METILFKFILVKNILFGHKLYKYIPMKKHEKAWKSIKKHENKHENKHEKAWKSMKKHENKHEKHGKYYYNDFMIYTFSVVSSPSSI